ncbi:MAG: hypothetical protein LC804_20025 [Acidobacteria bacterium]|nr:hypothetical protein [Acidobacteriota bacterium]
MADPGWCGFQQILSPLALTLSMHATYFKRYSGLAKGVMIGFTIAATLRLSYSRRWSGTGCDVCRDAKMRLNRFGTRCTGAPPVSRFVSGKYPNARLMLSARGSRVCVGAPSVV